MAEITWVQVFLIASVGPGAFVYIVLRKRGLTKQTAFWWGFTTGICIFVALVFYLVVRSVSLDS